MTHTIYATPDYPSELWAEVTRMSEQEEDRLAAAFIARWQVESFSHDYGQTDQGEPYVFLVAHLRGDG